jgi:hypothetical protein
MRETSSISMATGQDIFTWSVQLAGYDHSHADHKGETGYDNFIDEFRKFPWIEQIEKAIRLPDKCAPTLDVRDLKTGRDFWISMAGDRKDHGYIIGYVYPKEKKTFLGLGAAKTIRWLEMYTTENTEVVIKITKLFFERNHYQFETNIRKLEAFGQMKAKDLAG